MRIQCYWFALVPGAAAGALAACAEPTTQARPITRTVPAVEAGMDAGRGATAPGNGVSDDSISGDRTQGVEAGPAEDCDDVYPYDDGYTCAEQAEWGKCDEVWLEGYCAASCNRCGVVPEAEPDMAGARNVFDAFAPKAELAPTPPMGWNSWNQFGCEIDEELIHQTADAMVSSGMRDAGYQYINIDDCWQAKERDGSGQLVADPNRFPSGIDGVADYVHDLGLKLGIYSDRGTHTCAGFPGSFGHEIEDADRFALWGVDYLKYDNCNIPKGRENGSEMREDYAVMAEALRRTERPVVFSICAWWFYDWMPEVGHLWRTTTDIKDIWAGNHQSVNRLLNWSGGTTSRYGAFFDGDERDTNTGSPYAEPLAAYAGPNAWNDPDMLEVGNGGMTELEYRSHFSLWALMAAPLVAGNDLRDMSTQTLETLTNADVIAVNQDPLGKQGIPISESTTLEVWAKQLQGEDRYAVILFNRSEEDAQMNVTWSKVGLEGEQPRIRDLWQHEDLGLIPDGYEAPVPSHGVVMLEVCGTGVCEVPNSIGDAGCNGCTTSMDAGDAGFDAR